MISLNHLNEQQKEFVRKVVRSPKSRLDIWLIWNSDVDLALMQELVQMGVLKQVTPERGDPTDSWLELSDAI